MFFPSFKVSFLVWARVTVIFQVRVRVSVSLMIMGYLKGWGQCYR